MKLSIKLAAILFLIITSFCFTNEVKSQEVSASVNFSVFHDNLQSYGKWENHPKYGQVWVYNQPGFKPYSTGGHWVYSQYGWTWVSDYPWGWATFHYGRWASDPSIGWFWVPGYEWAPGWVSWRTGGDYYGWAPLGPGLSISVGVNTIPSDRWVFVSRGHIADQRPDRYYVPPTKNITIIKNTTIINNVNVNKVSNRNVTYNSGPKREDVERDTKTKITVMNVNNSSKPGNTYIDNSKKTVNIYKPTIDEKTVVNKTVVNKNNGNDNSKTINSNNNNNDKSKTVNSNNDNNKSKTVNSNNKSVKKTPVKKAPAKRVIAHKKPAPKPQHQPQPKPKPRPKPDTSKGNN